jgi:alpha/beta superfamily hydrolase
MGGTMDAPLLKTLRDELVPRGWAVLRFNFRGIGGSEGTPATGEEEVQDAIGAVEMLRERDSSRPLAIAGWSFGGAVAVRTMASDHELRGCAAIAPAVKERPGVTAGLPDPGELVLGAPVLFVCGSNDDVVAPADCRAWVESIERGRFELVQGANHFFWGKYEELAGIVSQWLNQLL